MTEAKVGVFNGIKFSNPGQSEGQKVRATLSSQIPDEPGSFSSVPLVPPVVPPLTASNTVDTLKAKLIETGWDFKGKELISGKGELVGDRPAVPVPSEPTDEYVPIVVPKQK